MTYLGQFFISIFGTIFDFFVKYLGKRLALSISITGFLGALTAAFFTALYSLISSIQYSLADYQLAHALAILWPPHLSVCISVCFSAKITRWVYDRSIMYVGIFWSASK